MKVLGFILAALFLGVVLGYILNDVIKSGGTIYNFVYKRFKARKNADIDICNPVTLPKSVDITNPEKDRDKLINRIKKKLFKRKNK